MAAAVNADVNHAALSDPSSIMEDRFCPGCQKSVVTENGGVVVAFGQSFFHVDCFKCAKCGEQVTADTNLLLLSDGSPVCANCSYSCSVCRQPILDEAIMTGDDSYHAHCFKCKTCHKKIDELMFAKSSQGIYCMECHSERVARSRRHAQRQAEREKEKERERERENAMRAGAADIGSVSSRETAATDVASRLPASAQPRSSPSSRPGTASSVRSGGSALPDSASTSKATKDGSKTLAEHRSGDPISNGRSYTTATSSASATAMAPTLTTPPPRTTSKPNASIYSDRSASPSLSRPSDGSAADHLRSATSPVLRMDSLSVPTWSDGVVNPIPKKKSFDDGVRPLNLLQRQLSNASLRPVERPSQGAEGLGVGAPGDSNSRRDKRRSINPALALAHSLSAPPASESAPASPYDPTYGTPRHGNVLTTERTTSPPPMNFTSGVTAPLNLSSGSRPSTSSQNSSTLNAQHAGRARSASSSTYLPEHPVSSAHPSPRPSFTLDNSASQHTNQTGHHYHHHAAASDASILDTRIRNGESRRPPDLNLPNGHIVRAQRSFDDRSRSSSPSHNGVELELTQRRTTPSSPTSPSHYVDVPHSIESGTDTEAEGEESFRRDSAHGVPPPLPPKEHRGGKPVARPPQLDLDAIDLSRDSSDGGHSGEGTSELSLDSSPVERMSHATFIAPALPPIRISMGGTDFSDLLRSVGASEQVAKLRELADVKEEESAKLDEALERTLTAPPAAVSRRASKQSLTPRNDTTFIGSEGTNGYRRDAQSSSSGQRSREVSRDRSGSNTPSSAASANDHTLHAFPSIADNQRAITNGTSEVPRRNPRSSVESIVGFSLSLSEEMQRSRPSLEQQLQQRERVDSNASFPRRPSVDSRSGARITVTAPDNTTSRPSPPEATDAIKQRLQENVSSAVDHGNPQIRLDVDFAQSVLTLLSQQKEEYNALRRQLDSFKRTSQRYMEGFTVAQTEYDREAKARRDAEAEVTRLRVLLSGQAVRLAAISGESKRQEIRKEFSEKMSESLSNLEKDVSKLKAERDMTLAEVEQLSETRSCISSLETDEGATSLTRALSMRFDNIKSQYQNELLPLTEQRETLMREVVELKASRDALLEEATRLSARNEELAQLGTQYVRRIDTAPVDSVYGGPLQEKMDNIMDQNKASLTFSTTSTTVASSDESVATPYIKIGRAEAMEPPPQARRGGLIKWPGSKAPKENIPVNGADTNKQKGRPEHAFQQISVLRVARCDHCGDKMWGSQFRCTNCNVAVHTRCIHQVHQACTPQAAHAPREQPAQPAMAPLPPSLFGRDLVEQVRADSRDEPRQIPVIVEKCIDAVDTLALEFEGIYRKTGGSGLSRTITQLFERGDYKSFDLKDTDRFNDICSVTSVLKTYFRSLPNPLLTFDLHDKFVATSSIKDDEMKMKTYTEIVNELPSEHYHTARAMMLHLHRVCEKSDTNLMSAQNLGVVFGPTLMRSRDPGAEFSDMAGKALAVKWLVENAPTVFSREEQQEEPSTQS